MTVIKLTNRSYQRVSEIAQSTHDVRVLKRAQALLWLSEGEPIEDVAWQLQVSTRTVYNWLERYAARSAWPVEARLADAPRSGRPDTLARDLDRLLEGILAERPATYGYAATGWTVPLLQEHLRSAHQVDSSARSISRALERLTLRWGRPRHTLARRSLTWRQAKGGSSADSRRARVR